MGLSEYQLIIQTKKTSGGGAGEVLGSEEHLLLFQRNQGEVPAPTSVAHNLL